MHEHGVLVLTVHGDATNFSDLRKRQDIRQRGGVVPNGANFFLIANKCGYLGASIRRDRKTSRARADVAQHALVAKHGHRGLVVKEEPRCPDDCICRSPDRGKRGTIEGIPVVVQRGIASLEMLRCGGQCMVRAVPYVVSGLVAFETRDPLVNLAIVARRHGSSLSE